MENISLEATYGTPCVNFDAEKGLLSIEGRSIPEHANMFYRPLIEWIKAYGESNPPKTEVTIKLDYLNSSSHKFLLEIFEKLEPIHTSGTEIIVNWYYEEDDEELKDTGEEFADAVDVPFTFTEVEEF